MFSLKIQEYLLTEKDFIQGNIATGIKQHPAITFCTQWFSQAEEFTLQTSGSTGQPKIIKLSRQQMAASAENTLHALSIQQGNSALVCLNTAYIAGVMMLVRGMIGQLQLTLIEPVGNPLSIFSKETHFDFAAMVPLQVQNILKESPEKVNVLNDMKALIIGGAAVSDSLAQEVKELKCPVYSTYGMTETVSHIALKQLNPITEDTYHLLPHIEITTDARGCLMIKGSVTNNDWIITNDIATIHSPNSFSIIGRADNIINTGGVKVQTEKVEKTIEQLFIDNQITNRFFISGVEDDLLGQKIILVIEGLKNENTESLLFNNKAQFDKYEYPKAIYWSSEFKETPTAKIDKKETLKLLFQRSEKN